MGFATIDGRNINYAYPQEAESGAKQGHTVLMVHGAVDNHKVWASQHRYLEREHTPLSIDLPGHGESEGPPINNVADFRNFIKAIVDVMGLAPFVFGGHSMGGSMALDYAVHHPDDVEGLIIVGSSPDWDLSPDDLELWKTDPDSAARQNAGQLFSRKTSKRLVDSYSAQLSETPVDAAIADFEACDDYDLTKQIGQVKVPVLTICGDEEAWLEGSRRIHSRVPGSTLEIVPAAGHAILVEQPDQVNDALNAYLGTLS